MSVFSTISAEILIQPYQLEYLEEYVLQKLKHDLQGRIFSNEYGYITEIIGIEEIKFKCLSFSNHDGSMVYTVKFNAICENPKPGDHIYCPILYYDDDIMFSFVGPMEIIIQKNNYMNYIKNHDINDSDDNNNNNDINNNHDGNGTDHATQPSMCDQYNRQKSAVVIVDQTQLDISRNIIKVLAVLYDDHDKNDKNDTNDNNNII